MSQNRNVSGNNSAYILDSDTTILLERTCLDIKRDAESKHEQGCLIPLLLLVTLFESAFLILSVKMLKIAIAGELKILIPILFFGISNIPGLVVLLIVQSLIFPYHCVLDFHERRYKLLNGLLRISTRIPSGNVRLIVNLLHSRGDWGFGLKVPIRMLGLIVNLPVIPGRIIGSKNRTFHEIKQLNKRLNEVLSVEIVMPENTGKWHLPHSFAIFTGLFFVLGTLFVFMVLNHQDTTSKPKLCQPTSRSTIDVKLVVADNARKTFDCPESARSNVATVSRAVAVICGGDSATVDRYEARNDALRSIARRRDLPDADVAVLMAYLRSHDDSMRVERVAALKNDVMNLLRNQDPPAEGLVETLIVMFRSGKHAPAVLDYCIQHLGAMQNEITDDALRRRIREIFVFAARQTRQPYVGTALYSLAEDKRASLSQKNELKRLTVALCKQDTHPVARVSAFQLAGERGYKEILPILRETLSSSRRDAVLDIVSIGSLGLLGDESDLALLSRFSSDTRRSVAVKAAIKRIKERASK